MIVHSFLRDCYIKTSASPNSLNPRPKLEVIIQETWDFEANTTTSLLKSISPTIALFSSHLKGDFLRERLQLSGISFLSTDTDTLPAPGFAEAASP